MNKLLLIIILAGLSPIIYSQYRIETSTLANGGKKISGSGFTVNSTVGQSFIDKMNGSGYKIQNGFWYKLNFINSIEGNQETLLKEYKMEQNYPNPFNPTTTIQYEIPELSKVQIIIYDILGNEVSTLVNNSEKSGRYQIKFQAGNIASGVYFYKLDARSQISDKNFTRVGKMLLLK